MFHRGYSKEQSYYEVAQVCLNGHVITDRHQSRPQRRKKFCQECGSKTIHQCPNCSENIQGDYIVPGVVALSGSPPRATAFCHNCGKAFPWTQMRLEAVQELVLQADVLGEDKDGLLNSLPDLVADTPKTTVAATKWKKAFAKLGEHTALAMKEILIEVASESAKKLLFP